jgi:hypothetical protein
MEAENKMPDEFYEWLNDCPVSWVREGVFNEGLKYFFAFPEDEDEARRIFIEDLEQGELDEELRANVIVSNVGEVKNE